MNPKTIDYAVRVRVFAAVIAIVLGILSLRLVQLQVIDRKAYTGDARSNALREHRVLPARGVIYDRNSNLIVDNEPSYTILITPRYFDQERTALLAELLGEADTTVARKISEASRWSRFQPSPSFREVSFARFSAVQENLFRLPGVTYEVAQRRRYLTSAHASHALGYIREVSNRELEVLRERGYRPGDLVGKTGLEKAFEPMLRGEPGREIKLVNVMGMEVKSYADGIEDEDPVSGYDLHLAIDRDVQILAESLFVNKRGGAVALDPNTGEIIALVSKPDIDLRRFSKSMSAAEWQQINLQSGDAMFNRATMSGIPPGSTWKPFMALVGLQEGIITEHTVFQCRGGYRLGRRVFKDFESKVHGRITVRRAIQESCNSFFFHLMNQMDIETFHEWGLRFGFGAMIPLDVGEENPGLMPDSAYYNRTYPEGWTPGYTINLGVGQGDMLVTPLQLARYAAAVANGGLLHRPHLIRKLVHPDTGDEIPAEVGPPSRIPVDQKHFDLVREGMRLVMENGTGRWVQVPGVSSGGKTGTAQAPGGRDDHSVFIMFAPVDEPQIAVAVMVENGGFGARQAAPIASFLVEQYLNGEIAPRRKWLFDRVLSLASQPLEEGL